MIKTGPTTIAVAAVAWAFGPSASAAPPEALGKVHFETSCKPDAQQRFDQAMLYQHSFWYRASQRVFEEALKADPECGIADWGIALSLKPPNARIDNFGMWTLHSWAPPPLAPR